MKRILIVVFLSILCSSVAASSTSKDVIKSPTDIQTLQWVAYKEARGEPVETIRAVLDVVLNRAKKNRETILVTIRKPNQFPYIRYTGIRKVNDKKFLRKFWNTLIMAPVLSKEYIFFNHYKSKHQWATKHKRIGNLVFSQEKK
jgi:spore germination cell wall hydrolase CwlJ-like protein